MPDAITATADPDTVPFVWRTSAGVESDYLYGTDAEVTKMSTGVYTFAAPTIVNTGPHTCRAKNTGLAAAAELGVGVRRTRFTSPLI